MTNAIAFRIETGRAHWVPTLMLLAVAMAWGTSYGVAKTAIRVYPVLGFLAIRFLITFLFLLPALLRQGSARSRAALKVGFPLGLMLLAIFLCETFGLAKTTAANAAFLISLCVVLTPFAAWIVLKTRPTSMDLVATAMSLLGAFLLTSGVHFSFNPGDGLMICAAILRAFMVTFTKQRMARSEVDSLTLTAIQTAVVGVGCLALAFTGGSSQVPQLPRLPNDWRFWTACLYLVVFCTIFAFFVQNYAIRKLSPTRVHLLMGTEPVFGALFATLWLDEQLSTMIWVGGLLIVVAPIWATLRSHRTTPHADFPPG